MTRRVHLIVSGRVQSVGFRMFIDRAARELQLSGWVKNLTGGNVEVNAQGAAPMIDELIKRAETGPSKSQVTGISIRELEPDSSLSGFSVIF
ncbi:MAG: acylphosphatase [Chlorobium limicola]|uniref:acylphosphatase n=1 Tax=Chlorobium limicola (strain DSM 245 / NBRC 103803 / 6330) TaxID=290315 RepID=B3EE58_CHLL2|nr:acylphosphatase [Chlorobium limicola]ACD89192.1 acylphosphatase [Chlorobium limicola DSM 245]NTV21592.1 acylphosphatase [Chlorobium limicola]